MNGICGMISLIWKNEIDTVIVIEVNGGWWDESGGWIDGMN